MSEESTITFTNLELTMVAGDTPEDSKFRLQPHTLSLRNCSGTITNLVELLRHFDSPRLILDGQKISLGYLRNRDEMSPITTTSIRFLSLSNPTLDLIYAFFNEDLDELSIIFTGEGESVSSDQLAIWLQARGGDCHKFIVVCAEDSEMRQDTLLEEAGRITSTQFQFMGLSDWKG